MMRFAKTALPCLTALVLAAAVPAAARAQVTYVYAVKYVCGYNPVNVGLSLAGNKEGEPTVKLGNYATDVNIVNPTSLDASVRKSVLLLNRSGFPIGREPNFVSANWFDGILLPPLTATMDDCNRIAELMFGNPVPTPLPLLIGFLVLESQVELDVTAVYTAQACGNWLFSPFFLECLVTGANQPQGVSSAIEVEQITPKIR